jgi:hypothetical protein
MPHTTPNLDIGDEAVSDLLSQYQGKPHIEALIRSLVGTSSAQQPDSDVAKNGQPHALAELEEDFGDLHAYHVIDEASGAQLDQWGRLVGQARGSLGDVEFRGMIKARIRANFAEGTPFGLLSVASKLPYVPDYSILDVRFEVNQTVEIESGHRIEDPNGNVWKAANEVEVNQPSDVLRYRTASGYAHLDEDELDVGLGQGRLLDPKTGVDEVVSEAPSHSAVRYRKRHPGGAWVDVVVENGSWSDPLRRQIRQLLDDVRPGGIEVKINQLSSFDSHFRVLDSSSTADAAAGHRLDEGKLSQTLTRNP